MCRLAGLARGSMSVFRDQRRIVLTSRFSVARGRCQEGCISVPILRLVGCLSPDPD
jgi:hypothetical protein